jgi:hypothetical protein
MLRIFLDHGNNTVLAHSNKWKYGAKILSLSIRPAASRADILVGLYVTFAHNENTKLKDKISL